MSIPYRLDLAGGWLDQPFVSKYCEGSVITVCIEPTQIFNEKSGMATSTRNTAVAMWGENIPEGNKDFLSKVLFEAENMQSGLSYVSGSQDSYGIVYPGVNNLHYDRNEAIPGAISSILSEDILKWLEKQIRLIPLSPREKHYNVMVNANLTHNNVAGLSMASNFVWRAIESKETDMLGYWMKKSFMQQEKMFPSMVTPEIRSIMRKYDECSAGYKIAGAGGGGYLVVVGAHSNLGLRIKIRR